MACQETDQLNKIVIEDSLVAPAVLEKLTEWVDRSKSVNILICGKTGTGKSTLINGIIGKKVAKVGETLDPETEKVKKNTLKLNGVTVNVFDSPGLQDGRTLKELAHIDEIRKCCSQVDLFIYCIQMSETRFYDGCPDAITMSRLTEALGQEIWNNGLIVLTFANRVIRLARDKGEKDVQKFFCEKAQKVEIKLKGYLQTSISIAEEIANNIVVVPVGNVNDPFLPSLDSKTSLDTDSSQSDKKTHWLSNLWLKALRKTKHDAQPAMIKLNLLRLRNTKNYSLDDTVKTMSEIIEMQPIMLGEEGAAICLKEFGNSGQCIGKALARAIGVREAVNMATDSALQLLIALASEVGLLKMGGLDDVDRQLIDDED